MKTIPTFLIIILIGIAPLLFAQENTVKEKINAARTLIAEEKFDEAFDTLDKVLESDLRNAEALQLMMHQLNNLQLDIERMYKLMQILRNLTLKYQDSVNYYYLGNAYNAAYFVMDAKDSYEKARVLNNDKNIVLPDGSSLNALLIEHLNMANQRINALEQDIGKVDFMTKEGRKKAARLCIDAAYKKGVDIDGATILFTSAIYLAPDDPEIAMAYFGLGSMWGYAGSISLAGYYYNKAVSLKPNLLETTEVLEGLVDYFAFIKERFPEKWEKNKSTELYHKTVTRLKEKGSLDLFKKIE